MLWKWFLDMYEIMGETVIIVQGQESCVIDQERKQLSATLNTVIMQ